MSTQCMKQRLPNLGNLLSEVFAELLVEVRSLLRELERDCCHGSNASSLQMVGGLTGKLLQQAALLTIGHHRFNPAVSAFHQRTHLLVDLGPRDGSVQSQRIAWIMSLNHD